MRGHLPDEVMSKRKRGFGFPIGAWFRRDLRELAGDVFSPEHIARQGVFDPKMVQTLLREHEEQRQDYSDALLALLTFSIWFDQVKVA
jgi:asparagine synthase (glutamine-hydrolysing)